MSSIKSLAFLALATGLASVSTAQSTSGSGRTTRYWDCCKGSCSWPGKADVSSPVATCSKNDSPLSDSNTASACDGGDAHMCSNQSPWVVSDDLAYGFAAVSAGGSESDTCCSCYQLTFTSTSIAGKKMIVQATNIGADVGEGQFDLAIPGGGVGLFNACTAQWGAPSSGWGAQYGGISTDTCSDLPSALQPGCKFRFGDWFEGADNPTVDWEKVTCPKALTDITGCVRSGETPTASNNDAAAASPSSAATSSVATSSVASSSIAASSSSSSSSAAYSSAASSAVSSAASSVESPAESPVQTTADTYVASSATGVTNIPAAQSSAAAPEEASGDNEECEVQYVYDN